ncbi:hypothetical protein HQ489_06095 [Candidatus Woesearchaeota archaeon]|nr:hypothetical protein [Candidatus Woesearchaeota archaeon]
MATKECKECKKEFSSKEGLEMHNKSKHQATVKEPFFTPVLKKKIKYISVSVIGIVLIYLIFSSVSNIKSLPPTTMQGHIEVNPPSHIMKIPMQLAIHKHMLEHADAVEGGRPGIIINYNCKDYSCDNDLIEKLEFFAQKYPEHVYVAPFKNMDAKIALTKLNQQKLLEEYNEQIIDEFVR